jgi:DNA repair photolyase
MYSGQKGRVPNIIVHCTITGYGGTILEPGVPEVKHAINGMGALSNWLGLRRLVLRVDPIILGKGPEYGPDGEFSTSRRITDVFAQAYDANLRGVRIRVSFLDMYSHVIARFKKRGIPLPYESMHLPVEVRKTWLKNFGSIFEVCGEPGIECTGCISAKDCKILHVEPKQDKCGQRLACACLAMKYELLQNRHPCLHNCTYCFWRDV